MKSHFFRTFHFENGAPLCISAKFDKPLLSLPKHLKMTINMHDSSNTKNPRKSRQRNHLNTRKHRK